jgi:hypothetical protein
MKTKMSLINCVKYTNYKVNLTTNLIPLNLTFLQCQAYKVSFRLNPKLVCELKNERVECGVLPL